MQELQALGLDQEWSEEFLLYIISKLTIADLEDGRDGVELVFCPSEVTGSWAEGDSKDSIEELELSRRSSKSSKSSTLRKYLAGDSEDQQSPEKSYIFGENVRGYLQEQVASLGIDTQSPLKPHSFFTGGRVNHEVRAKMLMSQLEEERALHARQLKEVALSIEREGALFADQVADEKRKHKRVLQQLEDLQADKTALEESRRAREEELNELKQTYAREKVQWGKDRLELEGTVAKLRQEIAFHRTEQQLSVIESTNNEQKLKQLQEKLRKMEETNGTLRQDYEESRTLADSLKSQLQDMRTTASVKWSRQEEAMLEKERKVHQLTLQVAELESQLGTQQGQQLARIKAPQTLSDLSLSSLSSTDNSNGTPGKKSLVYRGQLIAEEAHQQRQREIIEELQLQMSGQLRTIEELNVQKRVLELDQQQMQMELDSTQKSLRKAVSRLHNELKVFETILSLVATPSGLLSDHTGAHLSPGQQQPGTSAGLLHQPSLTHNSQNHSHVTNSEISQELETALDSAVEQLAHRHQSLYTALLGLQNNNEINIEKLLQENAGLRQLAEELQTETEEGVRENTAQVEALLDKLKQTEALLEETSERAATLERTLAQSQNLHRERDTLWQAEREKLSNKLANCQASLEKQIAESRTLDASLETVTDDKRKLLVRLSEMEDEVHQKAALEIRARQQKERIDQLRRELLEASSEMDKLTVGGEESSALLKQVKAEAAEAKETVARYKKDLQAARRDLLELEDEVQKQTKALAEAQKENLELQKTTQQLKLRASEYEGDASTTQAMQKMLKDLEQQHTSDVEALQQQHLADLQQMTQALQSRHKITLEKQMQSMQSKLLDIEGEKQALESSLQHQRTENARLTSELAACQSRAEKSEAEVTALAQQLQSEQEVERPKLEAAVAELKLQVEVRDARMSDLEAQLAGYKDVSEQLHSFRERVLQLEKELVNKKDSISKLESNLRSAELDTKEISNSCQIVIQEQKSRIAALESSERELTEQLHQRTEDHKAAIKAYEDQVRLAVADGQSTKVLNASCQAMVELQSKQITQLEADVAQGQESQRKLHEVELALRDAGHTNTILKAELEARQAQLSKLEEQFRECCENKCKLEVSRRELSASMLAIERENDDLRQSLDNLKRDTELKLFRAQAAEEIKAAAAPEATGAGRSPESPAARHTCTHCGQEVSNTCSGAGCNQAGHCHCSHTLVPLLAQQQQYKMQKKQMADNRELSYTAGQMESENRNLQQRVTTLVNTISELEGENDALKRVSLKVSRVAQLDKDYQQALQELRTLSRTHQELAQEHQTAKSKIARLERAQEKSIRDIESLTSELTVARPCVDALNMSQAKIVELQRELDDCRAKGTDKIISERDHLRAVVSDLEQEIRALENGGRTSTTSVPPVATASANELKRVKQQLMAALLEKQQFMSSRDLTMHNMETLLQVKKEKCAQLERELEQTTEEKEQLETELARSQQELEQAESREHEAARKAKLCRMELTALQEERGRLMEALSAAKDDLEAHRKDTEKPRNGALLQPTQPEQARPRQKKVRDKWEPPSPDTSVNSSSDADDDQIRRLSEEAVALSQKMNELESAKNSLDQRLHKALEARSEEKLARESAVARANKLSQSLTAITDEHDALNQTHRSLQFELDQALAEVQQLKLQLSEAMEENSRLLQRSQQVSESLGGTQLEQDRLRAEKVAADKKVDLLSERVLAMQKLQDEYEEELENSAREYESMVAQLEAQAHSLRTENKDLRSGAEQTRATIARLESEITGLRQQKSAAEEANQRVQLELKECMRKREVAEQSLADAKKEVEATAAERAATVLARDKLLASTHAENAALAESVRQLQTKVEQLESAKAAAERQTVKSSESAKRTKQDLASSIEELETQLSQTREQLRGREEAVQAMQEKVASAQSAAHAAEASLASQESIHQALMGKLRTEREAAESLASNLRLELQRLREQHLQDSRREREQALKEQRESKSANDTLAAEVEHSRRREGQLLEQLRGVQTEHAACSGLRALVEEREKEIKNLRERAERAERTADQCKRECAGLSTVKTELEATTALLNDKTHQCQLLAGELEHISKEKQSLVAKVANLEEMSEKAAKRKEKLIKLREEHEAALHRASAEHERAQEELTEQLQKLKASAKSAELLQIQTKAEVSGLEQDLASRKNQLDEAKREGRQLKQELQDKQDAYSELKITFDGLRSQQAQSTAEVDRLTTQVRRLTQMKSAAEEQSNNSSIKLRNLEGKLSLLTKQSSILQEDSEKLATRNKELEAEVSTLQRSKTELQKEADKLKQSCETFRYQVEELQQQVEEGERASAQTVASLTSDCEQLCGEMDKLVAALGSANKETAECMQQKQELETQVTQQLATIDSLSGRESQLTDSLRQLELEVQSSKSQLAADTKRLTGKIEQAEGALAQERAAKESLRQQLEQQQASAAELRTKCAQTSKELESAASAIEQLRRELAKVTSQASSLRSEKTDLEQRVKGTSQELEMQRQTVSQLNQLCDNLTNELAGVRSSLKRVTADLDECGLQKQRLETEKSKAVRQVGDLRQQLEVLENKSKQVLEQKNLSTQELLSLQQQLTALQEEGGRASTLEQQRAVLVKQVEQLEEERKISVTSELERKNALQTARLELSELTTSKESAEVKLAEMTVRLEHLEQKYKEEVVQHGRRHSMLFAELGQVQRQRAQISGECQTWQEKGRELEEDLLLLQMQFRERTKQRNDYRDANKTLTSQLEQLNKKLSTVQDDKVNAGKRELQLESQRQECQRQLDSAKKQLQQREQQLQELNREREELRRTVSGQSEDVASLHAQKDELVEAKMQLTAELSALRSQLAQVKQEREYKDNELKALVTRHEELQQTARSLKETADAQRTANSELKVSVQYEQKRTQEAAAEAKERTEELSERAKLLEQARERLADECAEQKRSAEDSNSKLQATRLQLEQQSRKLGERVQQLQKELDRASRERDAKGSQLDAATRHHGLQLQKADGRIRALVEEQQSTRQQLQHAEELASRLRAESHALKETAEALQDSVVRERAAASKAASKLQEAEKASRALREQLMELKMAQNGLQATHSALLKESEIRQQQLEQTQTETQRYIDALKQDFRERSHTSQLQQLQLESQYESEITRLKETCVSLQEALRENHADNAGEIAALSALLDSREGELATVRSLLAQAQESLEQQRNQAEDQATAAEMARAGLQKECNEWQAQNASLSAQLVQVKASLSEEVQALGAMLRERDERIKLKDAQKDKVDEEVRTLRRKVSESQAQREKHKHEKQLLLSTLESLKAAQAAEQRQFADKDLQYQKEVMAAKSELTDSLRHVQSLQTARRWV